MKKIKLALFFLFSSMIILQLFFERDFSQLSSAASYFRLKGSFSQLVTDVKTIFAGERIRFDDDEVAEFKDRFIYIWTDEEGILHNSENMPKEADFKTVKMGNRMLNTQKALTQKEIERLLKSTP